MPLPWYLHSDPPSADEWQSASDAVRDALKTIPFLTSPSAATFIGVGGTITSLASLELGLKQYDAQQVDGQRLSWEKISNIIRGLRTMSLARRKEHMAFDPHRADIILAGADILLGIMDVGGYSEILVSDRGLRYGLALREFGYVA